MSTDFGRRQKIGELIAALQSELSSDPSDIASLSDAGLASELYATEQTDRVLRTLAEEMSKRAEAIKLTQRARHNRAALCHRLPDELLQYIFTLRLPHSNFVDPSDENAVDAYGQFRQSVCLSCRQWAELIRNTPEAWNSLVCSLEDPRFSLGSLRLALKRSDSAPLYILVYFPYYTEGPISQGAIKNFMTALHPALPRCHSLNIHINHFSQLAAFDTLSAVKQFYLNLARDGHPPAPPLDWDFALPSMTPHTLHILDDQVYGDQPIISSLLLDHLDPSELISLEMHARCTSDQLFKVLRASSKLRSIKVILTDPAPIPAGVQLDHLRSLSIDGNPGSLPHPLHAPSLESLTIDAFEFDGDTLLHVTMWSVWSRVLTVYPKLRALKLPHAIGTNDVLLSIVRDTKSLEDLTIWRRGPQTAAKARMFAGILDQLNTQGLPEGSSPLRRLNITRLDESEESTVGASLRGVLIRAPELIVTTPPTYDWGPQESDWRRNMMEQFENLRSSR